MQAIKKATLKHLFVFASLIVGMLVIVFVMGQFVSLHEDAYVDGLMSIVYVCAIILALHIAFGLFRTFTASKELRIAQWPKRLIGWYRSVSPLVLFAVIFSFITLVNSLMMVTGLDTPKTGVFTYQHLLIRALIVTLVVALTMHRHLLAWFRGLKRLTAQTQENRKKARYAQYVAFRRLLGARPFEATFSWFTILTLALCVGAILLNPFYGVAGGFGLYMALITLFLVLLVATTTYAVWSKRRSS